MKTKFKDVAHFYIGACIITNTSKQFQITGIHKGSLKEIICSNVPEINKQHFKYLDTIVYESFGFDECKVMLRPIVSITDAEALELGKIVTDGVVENLSRIDRNMHIDRAELFFSNETEKIDLIGPEINWMEEGNGPKKWYCLPVQKPGEVILWLTSKGFDIFGLIRNMEALPVTN